MGLFGGLLGGIFGGGGGGTSLSGDGAGGIGNSKSTDQTTNRTETTNNDYRRAVTGAEGLTAADGGTINYTSDSSQALGILDSVIGKSFANQTATSQQVANAYAEAKGRGAMTDYLILAGVGAAVLVAYFALKKG